jgi:hypothetical protein
MANKKTTSKASHADLHIVPQADGWTIKREAGDGDARTFRTQAEAIEVAKQQANRQADIIVHGRNGRTRHAVSKSPADELMFDFWKSLHGEGSINLMWNS